jgi:tryptophan halogenase
MLGNRFLLTMVKNDIKPKPNEAILEICERTNMPAQLLEASKHYLEDANYVHFGFEEGENACIYRVYLEFWTTWEDEINKRPGRSDPFLFGLGLKWNALDHANRALTKYTWYPSISLQKMRKRLSSIYEGPEYEKPLNIAKDILEVALRSTSHDRFLYIEAGDENSPRRSFDINIYKARIQLGELYPLFLTMCEHYSIDSEVFHTLYDPVRNELFGHIQGGIDKKGRDFITIYYGLEGR